MLHSRKRHERTSSLKIEVIILRKKNSAQSLGSMEEGKEERRKNPKSSVVQFLTIIE